MRRAGGTGALWYIRRVASELIMDATFDPDVHSVEDYLGRMELLFRLANESTAGVPA
jgi:hypothetical protein